MIRMERICRFYRVYRSLNFLSVTNHKFITSQTGFYDIRSAYVQPREKNVTSTVLRARERVIKLVTIMKRIIPL